MTNHTWEAFEERFSDMLTLVETHTGVSERENVKQFLAAKEAECQKAREEVLERVREGINKITAPMSYTPAKNGYNQALSAVLAHLDSLKKELPEEITK